MNAIGWAARAVVSWVMGNFSSTKSGKQTPEQVNAAQLEHAAILAREPRGSHLQSPDAQVRDYRSFQTPATTPEHERDVEDNGLQ